MIKYAYHFMNPSEQTKNKANTQVYAENISIYYGRCHYEYFNFVDFRYKQFMVCKIWERF
jgi:hypothetical protein